MNTYAIYEKGRRIPWLMNADSSGEAVSKVLAALQHRHGDDFRPPCLRACVAA